MTKLILKTGLLIIAFMNFISCSDDVIQPLDKNEAVNLQFPSYFPEMTFDKDENPITKNGVELGRKLFYEGRLSRNNTISCGFCHIQEHAFTHHGHTVSHGLTTESESEMHLLFKIWLF